MIEEVVTLLRSLIFAAVVYGSLFNAMADTLYKYRDKNGTLVFSDLPPATDQPFEQQIITSATITSPVVTFRREPTEDGITLWVDNPCHCVAEVIAQVAAKAAMTVEPGNTVRRIVPGLSTTKLLTIMTDSRSVIATEDIKTAWVFGDPKTVHAPDQPYRPPFAAAQKFEISQAFPDEETHAAPSSRYAVDIVMPVQTAIYAARGGIVVEVAHNNFRGGADRGKYGAQANLVKILHDDGSFALYAHLSWDSIRVRNGQRVERGELIAASGNTGFTTGPHLHFVVLMNVGLRTESVPVTFSAGIGAVVVPRTGEYLQNP